MSRKQQDAHAGPRRTTGPAAWAVAITVLASLAACSNNPAQDTAQNTAQTTAAAEPGPSTPESQPAEAAPASKPSIWDDKARATVEAGQAPRPTVVGYAPGDDPLMGFNRAVFAFNDVAYRFALVPAAKGWEWAVPAPVRQSIGNAFHNIRMPIRAVNHGLQGRWSGAGRNLLRFTINSTLGLGGLFDPAKAWFDLERADTGFDETLATWGAGPGTYLVLPLLGPSTLREGTGALGDYALNPIPYLTEQPEQTALMLGDGFQGIVPALVSYETLRARSEDPYVFFRELHLQGLKRDDAARHAPDTGAELAPDRDTAP